LQASPSIKSDTIKGATFFISIPLRTFGISVAQEQLELEEPTKV
jgi:hypothetical protein